MSCCGWLTRRVIICVKGIRLRPVRVEVLFIGLAPGRTRLLPVSLQGLLALLGHVALVELMGRGREGMLVCWSVRASCDSPGATAVPQCTDLVDNILERIDVLLGRRQGVVVMKNARPMLFQLLERKTQAASPLYSAGGGCESTGTGDEGGRL